MIAAQAGPRTHARAALVLMLVTLLLSGARGAGAAFQVFTTADGLAGDGVTVILEDRNEHLWFGTSTSGVSRFDGSRWTSFGPASGFPGIEVFDLLETADGHVWAATSGGVARWDGAAWTAYGAGEGLPPVAALQLVEGDEPGIWVAFVAPHGVAHFDGATWTRFTTANGLVSDSVRDLLRARDGALWFATPAGVSRYDGASWTSVTTADGLASNNVAHLLETRSGAMWFATSGGLTRRDGPQWTTFTSGGGLSLTAVTALLEDERGGVWAGAEIGLGRFDGSAWRAFTTADGLADNTVDIAFRDAGGRLWFGSSSSTLGVSRWDGRAFDRFTTADGLAGNHVSDILQDRAGNVWLATGSPGAGVTRFDGALVRSWFADPDGLTHSTVLTVEADTSDALWIGTVFGVNHFDGTSWTRVFASPGGLPGDTTFAVLEDRTGRLWFGTNGGLATRSGGTFTRITAVTEPVLALAEDAAGHVWAGTRSRGGYRFDGTTWTNFRADTDLVRDSLASDHVRAIVAEGGGATWLGTASGVSRYDGTSWTTYRVSDGLAGDFVHSAARDSSGALWFGTEQGASRFTGGAWRTFTENDGLANRAVLALHAAPDGVLWFGTLTGASRYDGTRFITVGQAQGLAGARVQAVTGDRRDRLWFGTVGGLSRLEPDRVPPRAVVDPEPLPVSTSRAHTLSFKAAFGESQGIAFSHALDGEPGSDWSTVGNAQRGALADGVHTFAVRARDEYGNVQDPPTQVSFEVDATAPAVILASPPFGPVRDVVAVTGTAADARFDSMRVEVRAAGTQDWTVLAISSQPVVDDTLAVWDTRGFADGSYDLRVAVADTLGLEGVAQTRVIVDNVFPFADQTSPARIAAAQGGDVYTTNAELHLFFPPHAFDRDAVVTLEPAAPGAVPDSLGPGIVRLTSGFDLAWAGAALQRGATLEFSHHGATPPPGATPALYAAGSDAVWRRIGGTYDRPGAHVAATIEQPGRLALFAESVAPQGGAMLSALALTPRVFSPSGAYSSTRIGIGFTLGRAAPVTVKVYNRAGRLVREVASGLSLGPGANLVYWDGRDRDGAMALEGLYVVTVEALAERRTQTLAVVR